MHQASLTLIMKQQKQNKKNTYEVGDWDTETDNYLVAIFHWDIY
jgi:hypothetical protein